MIDAFFSVFKALNSEDSPWQIAFALALGMIVGLTPFLSLHNLLILLVACLLRVHFGTFLAGWVSFSAIAYLADPWMNAIGEALLTNSDWAPFWTQLYQLRWPQLFHFHNTMTLGSLVFALMLFVPVVLIARWLVGRYRRHVMAWLNQLKIVQMVKASTIVSTISKISKVGG